jgi:hypothetical protein
MKLFIIALLSLNLVHASSVSLDLGATKTVFNRISIPNNQDDQISLPKGKTLTSYRLTGYFDLASGNQLYVLVAPLETSYKFRSDKNFRFNNTNFSSSTNTTFNL